ESSPLTFLSSAALAAILSAAASALASISRNFVKTRTPTQVASHAQKYFLRRNNQNRRRRRSSLFDITTDSVSTYTNFISRLKIGGNLKLLS
ncbi:Transcription factor SRM1, partial [Linum perenne]